MKGLTDFIDSISRRLAIATMAVVAILVCVMIYEVIMRRVFNAPTLWAFDLAYMLNGCIFIGASSFALLQNAHIRIDFLSSRFSVRTRSAIEAAFLLLCFLPLFGLLAHAAVMQSIDAYLAGTTDRVSPWAPKIWPYYAGLAIGICGLWLQALSESIKCICMLAGNRPESVKLQAITARGDGV
jgi:TRAP-type mannitol/chloroaromatic compound transport system permease small subunit